MNKLFAYRLSKILIALFIVLLALIIRLEYLLQTENARPEIRGDAYYYMTYAKNLDVYGTFSKDVDSISPKADSFWAPGFPTYIVFINKISKLLDSNFYFSLLLGHAILGAMVCLLTLLIGLFFLSSVWAYAAAFLVSISPHLISMGNYLLTETLFSFVLLLALYCFLRLKEKPGVMGALVTGFIFGLSYLVNPVILFAPILIAPLILFFPENRFGKKKLVVYLLLSYLLVVFSWSIRNQINVEKTQQSSGDRVLVNLIIGSHDDYFDIWRKDMNDPNNPATIDEKHVQGSLKKFIPILWHRITQQPLDYLTWYFWEKPYLLWSWSILVGQGDIYVFPVTRSLYDKNRVANISYRFMKSIHLWLFGLALLGLILVLTKKDFEKYFEVYVLYLTIVYVSSVYVVLQAEPRYSIPLRPEMYLCAMFVLAELSKKIAKQVNTRLSDVRPTKN